MIQTLVKDYQKIPWEYERSTIEIYLWEDIYNKGRFFSI